MKEDLYEILQVSPNAEDEVIEAAYKRLSRMYHPDVNKNSDAVEKMKKINNAYQILSDKNKRQSYNATKESSTKYQSKYEEPIKRNQTEKATAKPFRFNYKLLGIIILLIMAGLFFKGYNQEQELSSDSKTNNLNKSKISYVVDGNTLQLENNVMVHFKGIQVPSTNSKECYSTETFDEIRRLLNNRQIVTTVNTADNSKVSEISDYVYLPLDNGQYLFVNDYLVRTGFAKFDAKSLDNKFAEQFKDAEKQAKEKNLGLWNKCN